MKAEREILIQELDDKIKTIREDLIGQLEAMKDSLADAITEVMATDDKRPPYVTYMLSRHVYQTDKLLAKWSVLAEFREELKTKACWITENYGIAL